MSKGNLNASAPDAINWHNAGIPTNSENIDLVEGIEGGGDESGGQFGTNEAINFGPGATAELGMGPGGNMFGASAPNAQSAIDESLKYNLEDSVVMVRPELQPVESVEGFGEPTPFTMATPMVNQITK